MNVTNRASRRSGGRRAKKSSRVQGELQKMQRVWSGGQFKPLSEGEIGQVLDASFRVLENLGVFTDHEELLEKALARGAVLNAKGRLCFPRSLAEDMVAAACKNLTLHGLSPENDLDLSGNRVHFATNGQTPSVVEYPSLQIRPAELLDVYDFARLGDFCQNVHQFTQTNIACAYEDDTYRQDLNVAYALLSGTKKNVGQAFTCAESVADVAQIAHVFAGGEEKFRERPFLSMMQCPVVAPLNLATDTCNILSAGVKQGFPIYTVMFGQGGATAPAPLAGNLMQTTAEALASLFAINILAEKSDHPVLVGNWQGICDLRTGALTCGSGEMALVNSAGAQVINALGLPSAISGGVTDSKWHDTQRGAEVALTVALSATSGPNMVSECLGNMAAYMAMSYEAFLCDNDVLGACGRVLRGIEVSEDTLAYDVIEETIYGSGHYLDKDQSLQLMETEFVYPALADRDSYKDWSAKETPDIGARAHERVREILSSHFPRNLDPETDAELRKRFDLDLDPKDMMPDTCRWSAKT